MANYKCQPHFHVILTVTLGHGIYDSDRIVSPIHVAVGIYIVIISSKDAKFNVLHKKYHKTPS